MTDPNSLLAGLRTYLDAARQFAADHDGAADVTALANAAHYAAQLDGHLTAGGNPPTGWTDRFPVRWYPDEEKPEDAPEGFEVVAHMSKVHPGVNVEIDAPDGMPLTVHVNDGPVVNVVIGTDEPADSINAPHWLPLDNESSSARLIP